MIYVLSRIIWTSQPGRQFQFVSYEEIEIEETSQDDDLTGEWK